MFSCTALVMWLNLFVVPVQIAHHVRLEQILTTWAKADQTLQCLDLTFFIEEEDAASKQKTRLFIDVKIAKSVKDHYLIRFEMFGLDARGQPDRTKLLRRYLLSNTGFHDFDILSKTIRTAFVEMPKSDGSFCRTILGFDSVDARKRYALSICQHDKHFTWIKARIKPRSSSSNWSLFSLVLDFDSMVIGVVNYSNRLSPKDLPLRLKCRQPSGNIIDVEITRIELNEQTLVKEDDFSISSDLKSGWRQHIQASEPKRRFREAWKAFFGWDLPWWF